MRQIVTEQYIHIHVHIRIERERGRGNNGFKLKPLFFSMKRYCQNILNSFIIIKISFPAFYSADMSVLLMLDILELFIPWPVWQNIPHSMDSFMHCIAIHIFCPFLIL